MKNCRGGTYIFFCTCCLLLLTYAIFFSQREWWPVIPLTVYGPVCVGHLSGACNKDLHIFALERPVMKLMAYLDEVALQFGLCLQSKGSNEYSVQVKVLLKTTLVNGNGCSKLTYPID